MGGHAINRGLLGSVFVSNTREEYTLEQIDPRVEEIIREEAKSDNVLSSYGLTRQSSAPKGRQPA